MTKRFKRVLFCSYTLVCCLWFSLMTAPACAEERLKILMNDWASQAVIARIAGFLFEFSGHEIEYVQSTVDDQWWRLAIGKSHIQVEIWEGTMIKKYSELIKLAYIVDAGSHNVTSREDWWYPGYMEELCPGLPDWRALNDCSELFATPETKPKGRYLSGPWEKPDAAKIRALQLNFKLIKKESAGELKEALLEAVKTQQPILLFNWKPSWLGSQYEGKFVEFPDYAPECESKPGWGLSSIFPWDCGNPKNGWVKKIASSNVPERWPCAFRILENLNFTNEMIYEISAWVDRDGLSYSSAADRWVKENSELWKTWIPEQCDIG